MKVICGIYKITNQVNGKCYIGQSINIARRWRDHKKASSDASYNAYDSVLHKAFRKYGIENFSFEVLEECSQESLNAKEIYWINYFNSDDSQKGYNLTPGGDNVGQKCRKLTDEQLQELKCLLKTTLISQADLAKQFNISQMAVSDINRGISYPDLNEDYPLRDSNAIRGWNLHPEKHELKTESKVNKSNKSSKSEKFIKSKDKDKSFPKVKIKNIKICPVCGKEYDSKAKTCSVKCGRIRVKKVKIVPKRSALKYLIRNYSFEWIGRQFGVTGNAIKKYCDKFDLPRTKKEINSYSNEEWKKI